MYILTRANKVIDYCEAGYTYIGNTVVCESKGKTFEDCTIVYTEKQLPYDIDIKEYEYLHGEFVNVKEIPKDRLIADWLYASSWDSDGNYIAFNSLLPSEMYDLEISLRAEELTTESKEAFDNAQIVGYFGDNRIKAMGDIPQVDIPIIIKAVSK